MSLSNTKVLFFAEGATLAHVLRPFALARDLDPGRLEVTFCRPPAFAWLTSAARFRVVDLQCLDGAVFARRLEYGTPLYGFLERQEVEESAIDDKGPEIDRRYAANAQHHTTKVAQGNWAELEPLQRDPGAELAGHDRRRILSFLVVRGSCRPGSGGAAKRGPGRPGSG